MRIRPLTTALCIVALFLLAPAPDAAARARAGEVVLEVGGVQPFGDLADDHSTPKGWGAGAGWAVGVGFRQGFAAGWSVAPSFHYVEPGDYAGTGDAGDFTVSTNQYRYGADLRYSFAARPGAPRPFVGFGAALLHNRMREEYDDGSYFADAVDAVGLSALAGVRIGTMEATVRYDMNRFDTNKFWLPEDASYSWDVLLVTVGFVLPDSF